VTIGEVLYLGAPQKKRCICISGGSGKNRAGSKASYTNFPPTSFFPFFERTKIERCVESNRKMKKGKVGPLCIKQMVWTTNGVCVFLF
jgi:hypothetical protein